MEKTLESPLDTKEQSILKEISPEHLLEGLMLKLKLQYFGHLIRRANSLEKILMLGKIERKRKREWQLHIILIDPRQHSHLSKAILKEINTEYSLEGLMLKLQYFGHLMRRTDSLEKTLMLEKIEGRRRRGRQRMRWLDGISDSVDTSLLSKLQIWSWTGKPGMLQSMGSQRVGHD